MRLITAKNVKMGYLQIEPREFVDPDIYDEWMTRGIPQKGDVLFTTEAPLGNVAQLDTAEKVVFAQRIIVMQPDRKFLDATFLKYLLISGLMQKRIHEKGTGATVKGIKSKLLKKIPIPFPTSLAEQKRIVAILDEAFEGIDSAIANTEKNLANARELFESYLNAIFTRKGNDWVDVTLGEIATFRNGLNFTKNSKGESIKIVGVKDFQNNFWIDEEQLETVTVDGDLKEIDVLREGDILTVRSNGNKELIGRCVLAGELSEKTSHSGFTIRIRIERQDIYLPFAVHFLKSRTLRRRLIESGDGISISSLNQQKLSLIELSFPPLEKQKSLVTAIDELLDASQRLEAIYQQKLAALNELKQSILQKAFSGELTVEVGDVAVEGAKEVVAA
jgi:type I restriction enzyme S subunit